MGSTQHGALCGAFALALLAGGVSQAAAQVGTIRSAARTGQTIEQERRARDQAMLGDSSARATPAAATPRIAAADTSGRARPTASLTTRRNAPDTARTAPAASATTADETAVAVTAVTTDYAAGTLERERRRRDPANPAVYRAAQQHRGPKILVSTNERRLMLISGKDTLLDTSVGIGMAEDFEYEGKKFRFETPTGRRRVLKKEEKPFWTVPEWHYMERASYRNLQLVRLKHGDRIRLRDGSTLAVKDNTVGRINQFGNFWEFEPGMEIIFDGKVFMPPMDTPQRRVPDALGPFKLDMGDGYLIHGTNLFNEDTIGGLVSHGCVRLTNSDLDRLYYMVEVGTPVFIY